MERLTIKKWVSDRTAQLKDVGYSEQVEKLIDTRNRMQKELDTAVDRLRARQDLLKAAVQRRLELAAHRVSFVKTLSKASFKLILSLPFIYGMIIPAGIMHIGLEIYHQIGFRLYGIPLVERKKYFIYDRVHLAYLNWYEKLNCAYCSYFNGLMGYASEIAGRTERHWCPIKHARRRAQEHSQYDAFFEYLDGDKYRKDLDKVRKYEKR